MIALWSQWDERDYSMVEESVRRFIPAGSIVWGTEQSWYALELSGSSLRLLGQPDSSKHDFLLLRRNHPVQSLRGFTRIAEFGLPLPKLLGHFEIQSFDYQMEVWQSIVRMQHTSTIKR